MGDGFSTKICRERCGSKYCVVHVLHQCSGLAISQMSTSTSSSGQGGASPTLETVVVGRVREFDSMCSPPKQMCGRAEPRRRCSCQPSPHRKIGEGHRDPRRGESSSARFDCSVEASSGARSRASIGVRLDSCQAFVERARKRLTVAEEEVTKALRTKSTREFELEQGLARLAQLREEAASREREVPARGVAADPPATIPSTSAEEVNLLRATVAELRREQVSLMAQLAQQTETARAIERSGRMETLIDDADADLRASQRFTPY